MKIEDAAKNYSAEGALEILKLEDFTGRQEGDIYISPEGNIRAFYHSEGHSRPMYLKHSYRDLVTGEFGFEEEKGNEDVFKHKKYHLVTEEELPWIIHMANKEIVKRIISSTRLENIMECSEMQEILGHEGPTHKL